MAARPLIPLPRPSENPRKHRPGAGAGSRPNPHSGPRPVRRSTTISMPSASKTVSKSHLRCRRYDSRSCFCCSSPSALRMPSSTSTNSARRRSATLAMTNPPCKGSGSVTPPSGRAKTACANGRGDCRRANRLAAESRRYSCRNRGRRRIDGLLPQSPRPVPKALAPDAPVPDRARKSPWW